MSWTYKILVEGSPYGWRAETIGFEDVVKFEYPDAASGSNFRVTYSAKRDSKKETGELSPGDTVDVVDNISFEIERL